MPNALLYPAIYLLYFFINMNQLKGNFKRLFEPVEELKMKALLPDSASFLNRFFISKLLQIKRHPIRVSDALKVQD